MKVSYSDEESLNVSSSEEGEIWKRSTNENLSVNSKHSSKRLKKQPENFFNLDDCIDANFNYESLCPCLVSQSKSSCNRNDFNSNSSMQEDLVPITFGELISKVKEPLYNKIKKWT